MHMIVLSPFRFYIFVMGCIPVTPISSRLFRSEPQPRNGTFRLQCTIIVENMIFVCAASEAGSHQFNTLQIHYHMYLLLSAFDVTAATMHIANAKIARVDDLYTHICTSLAITRVLQMPFATAAVYCTLIYAFCAIRNMFSHQNALNLNCRTHWQACCL